MHPWRQHEGKGARFEDDGVLVEPPVVVHSTEEYVTVFLKAGFALESLSEARSPGDPITSLPRLLVMGFLLPRR